MSSRSILAGAGEKTVGRKMQTHVLTVIYKDIESHDDFLSTFLSSLKLDSIPMMGLAKITNQLENTLILPLLLDNTMADARLRWIPSISGYHRHSLRPYTEPIGADTHRLCHLTIDPDEIPFLNLLSSTIMIVDEKNRMLAGRTLLEVTVLLPVHDCGELDKFMAGRRYRDDDIEWDILPY